MMMNDIETIIQSNNDHTRVIEILINKMSKHEAIGRVLDYKLGNKLNKNKTILVDMVLNGLHQLCQTT